MMPGGLRLRLSGTGRLRAQAELRTGNFESLSSGWPLQSLGGSLSRWLSLPVLVTVLAGHPRRRTPT
eukprot:3846141-Rhodomonas_salina.2